MKKIKYLYQNYFKPNTINLAANILGKNKLIIADIGAAGGLVPHWQIMEGYASFYLFEPHNENFQKLKIKYSASKYSSDYLPLNIALSKNGGDAILYILNTPTGSSILPVDLENPEVNINNNYIFPIKQELISTKSFKQLYEENILKVFDGIKLDVQGAELDIIKGMNNKQMENLIFAELEVGFKSIYKNAPTISETLEYFEANNFKCYDINLVPAITDFKGNSEILLKDLGLSPKNADLFFQLHEGDLLFFKDPNWVIGKGDVLAIKKLITIFCVYGFYADALKTLYLANDSKVIDNLEVILIKESIKKWAIKISKDSIVKTILKYLINKIQYLGLFKPWKYAN